MLTDPSLNSFAQLGVRYSNAAQNTRLSSHQMRSVMLKVHRIQFQPGLRPGPR